MILINPTTRNQILDDDNFWDWFKREFDTRDYNTFIPGTKDILVNSSFHKVAHNPDRIINLHLELMKEIYDKYSIYSGYKPNVKDILYNCKHSRLTVIPSHLMYYHYRSYCKKLEVIPIGVNMDKFRPLSNKQELQDKYKLPKNKRIGFWSGNTGLWRGYNDLVNFCKNNSDVYWIFNHYRYEKIKWPGMHCQVHYRVSQENINELLNISDFYLCTNQLGPYYMSDWEAIASGVPIIDTVNIPRELPGIPSRNKMIRALWDREDVKLMWQEIIFEYLDL